MDIPNAFVGWKSQPTSGEISTALASNAPLWTQLLASLANEQGVVDQEWKSSSPKYGWSLILKLKKRNIVYLGPCAGCFRASIILGSKAVVAAHQSSLSKSVLKLLDEAPRYPEGTGLRLIVKSARDLAAIQKLVAIKLAN